MKRGIRDAARLPLAMLVLAAAGLVAAAPGPAPESPCPAGFGGRSCNVCMKDTACPSSTVCAHGIYFFNEMHVGCDAGRDLRVIGGTDLTLSCDRSTRTCGYQVFSASERIYHCGLSGCNFTSVADQRTSTVVEAECANTMCTCDGNCGFLRVFMKYASDPTHISCDRSTSVCRIQQSQMPFKPVVTCTLAGTCVDPVAAMGIVDLVQEEQQGSGGMTSKTRSIIVVCCVVGGAITATAAAYFCTSRGVLEQRDGLTPRRPPGVSLQFQAISVSDYVEPQTLWTRASNWVSGREPAMREVLDGVFGECPKGFLMAIMGDAGAEASRARVLMDVLSGRKSTGRVEGQVLVDGEPANGELLSAISGYVTQAQEDLNPLLTVRETLTFSAMLKLPRDMDKVLKVNRVEDTLKELQLVSVAESRVGRGHEDGGIGGADRRRLSIGNELVTQPAILFLEEPTAGLDSQSAHSVVRTLQSLCKRHSTTILFTMQQPRTNMLRALDRLLLLCRGRSIYSGPTTELARHFELLGRPLPPGQELPEYLLDMVGNLTNEELRKLVASAMPFPVRIDTAGPAPAPAPGAPAPAGASSPAGAAVALPAGPVPSPAAASLRGDRTLLLEPEQRRSKLTSSGVFYTTDGSIKKPARSLPGVFVSSWATQYSMVLTRAMRGMSRDLPFLLSQFVALAAVGILTGLAYFRLGDDMPAIQNRAGIMFFLCLLVAANAFSFMPAFARERATFVRERASCMYRVSAFFLARVTSDIIPVRVFPFLLLAIPAFFLSGLSISVGRAWTFMGTLVLLSICLSSLCFAVSCFFASAGAASTVASSLLLASTLLSGFLLQRGTAPPVLAWLQHASPLLHAFEALLASELSAIPFLVPTQAAATVGAQGAGAPTFFPEELSMPRTFVDGATLMGQYGVDAASLSSNLAALGAMSAAYLLLSYLFLLFRCKEVR
eukprot:tig00020537_g10275.t1